MAATTNCQTVGRLPNLFRNATMKRFNFFFDLEIIVIVSNNIDVYVSAASTFV